MLIASATLLSLLPQGPGSSTAPVVINELHYDDNGAGADAGEFA
jgi:hypothetical protein